jgi:hypothetical protein
MPALPQMSGRGPWCRTRPTTFYKATGSHEHEDAKNNAFRAGGDQAGDGPVFVNPVVELREPQVIGIIELDYVTTRAFPNDVHIDTQFALAAVLPCRNLAPLVAIHCAHNSSDVHQSLPR